MSLSEVSQWEQSDLTLSFPVPSGYSVMCGIQHEAIVCMWLYCVNIVGSIPTRVNESIHFYPDLYLGSMFSRDGRYEMDVERRIAAGNSERNGALAVLMRR